MELGSRKTKQAFRTQTSRSPGSRKIRTLIGRRRPFTLGRQGRSIIATFAGRRAFNGLSSQNQQATSVEMTGPGNSRK